MALRVVVEVTGLDTKDALTLPFVAAKVDLGGAKATSHLIVQGYRGDDLGDLMPQWTSFSVDSYSQYMTTVSKIQTLVMKNQSGIDPVLISTTRITPKLATASEAFGQIWALEHLSHGDHLSLALSSLPASVDMGAEATIRRVYEQELGTISEIENVPEEVRSRAREAVHGFALSRHWWR